MSEEFEEELEIQEETPESRLEGLEAEVNQMKWMIEENIRKIAEGDDVEGREYLKAHLEREVSSKSREIESIKQSLGL